MEQIIESLQKLLTENVQGLWIAITYILVSYVITIILKTFLRRYVKPRSSLLVQSWIEPVNDIVYFLLLIASIVFGSRAAGIDVTLILVIASIFTAGISLALDGSFKDAMASFKILSGDHFRVKEIITVSGEMTGEVEEFTLLYTTLYVPNMGKVVMNNSTVIDSRIQNHSRVPVQISVRIPILNVDNRTTIIKFIKDKLKDNDKIVHGSVKVLHAFEPGGSEIFTLQFKVHSYKDRLQIQSDVSVFISDALEEIHYKLGEVSLVQHIGN